MQKFIKPVKYNAEGIKTRNQFEKSIINFCVKVGVDPKYYGEIFEEIAKIDSLKKPFIKKLTFLNSEK